MTDIPWIEGPVPAEHRDGGFLQTGIQVEAKSSATDPTKTQLYLVGDVNDVGGVCGCCPGFDHEDVIRWRRLIPENLLYGQQSGGQ